MRPLREGEGVELAASGGGEAPRDLLLIHAQNAHAEESSRTHPRVGVRAMVDAHEHERWLEADGAEGTDGHAQRMPGRVAGRDHRDTARELAHGPAKGSGIHPRRHACCRHRPRVRFSSSWPASSPSRRAILPSTRSWRRARARSWLVQPLPEGRASPPAHALSRSTRSAMTAKYWPRAAKKWRAQKPRLESSASAALCLSSRTTITLAYEESMWTRMSTRISSAWRPKPSARAVVSDTAARARSSSQRDRGALRAKTRAARRSASRLTLRIRAK